MKRELTDPKLESTEQLYMDDVTGIVWLHDSSSGADISVHANIDKTGSVKGMKKLGYWKDKDRTIKSYGYIYNIDSFICNGRQEKIVARHCRCQGCLDSKERNINGMAKDALKIFCSEELYKNITGSDSLPQNIIDEYKNARTGVRHLLSDYLDIPENPGKEGN